MRLSTRFVLLVAGTAVIPVLVLPILVVGIAGPAGRTTPLEFIRLQKILTDLEDRRYSPEKIAEVVGQASPRAEVFVVGPDGRVIASSTGASTLSQFMSPQGADRHAFFHVRLATIAGDPYSAVIAAPMVAGHDAGRGTLAVIVWSLPVVFMTLVSLLIIRSINRSIGNLERATRRIGDGDLDFKLDARGNDRLASLTRSFDKMREKVREETAARSRFLLGVSHDLKTPLASIAGYLDAIRDGLAETPEQLERYLTVIRDKTGLLESRIRQLIDFVKLETGEWKRSREAVALRPFLEEAAAVFRTEAEARGLELAAVMELSDEVTVVMDGDLVFRVLENLMDNAFRHADAGSRVRFAASQGPEQITVQVCNRGEEIPAEDLPFIFEPFFRGSKARRETGFGLGLSAVKSVVDSHDWTIDVASAGGETCLTMGISLP